MGIINLCSYCKLTYYFGGDEMRTFTTENTPLLILKVMIDKDLLQQGDTSELFCLRGMISVFNIQNQITQSTYFRFHKLIRKAINKELKLNIKKDKK